MRSEVDGVPSLPLRRARYRRWSHLSRPTEIAGKEVCGNLLSVRWQRRSGQRSEPLKGAVSSDGESGMGGDVTERAVEPAAEPEGSDQLLYDSSIDLARPFATLSRLMTHVSIVISSASAVMPAV